MVTDPRFARIPEVDDNQSTAEEAALALAGIIVIVLTMAMGAIVLLEFFDLLPAGAEFVAILSLVVFVMMVARAILTRALSTPAVYGRRVAPRRVIGPPGI